MDKEINVNYVHVPEIGSELASTANRSEKDELAAINNEVPNPIVLKTEDCLRDFWQLQECGIKFINEPSYCQRGLSAKFVDTFNNEYIFIRRT